MWPVGKILSRKSSATKNASLVSSACLMPLYCTMPAGLASTTGYFSACSPSTSQYQLYVDSTPICSSRFLYGARNFSTRLSLHSTFWWATRLPSISIKPITTLLLWRSIPAINFFIGRLSVLVLLFILLTNANFFTARRPPRSITNALNVYQSFHFRGLLVIAGERL